MKHISAHFDIVDVAVQKFAWLPVRSSFSEKLLWLTKYTELRVETNGTKVTPAYLRRCKLVYTPEEYTYYCLSKDKNYFK